MTSASTIRPALQDGAALSAHLQADFYAKLARIESEILAGKHPRIKLSNDAIEKFEPAFAQVQTKAATTSTSSHLNDSFKTPILSPQRQQQKLAQVASLASPTSQRPTSSQFSLGSRQTLSQIDPVLLTKSDELVRAETTLKRQRLERSLKDAVDSKKKKGSRSAEQAAHDAPNRFDGSKVLTHALLRVKPVSGYSNVNTNDASGDSSPIDENSYYSSKGNSWTSEEQEVAHQTDTARVVHVDAFEQGEKRQDQRAATLKEQAQKEQDGIKPARAPYGTFSTADKSPRNVVQHADTIGPSPRHINYTRHQDDQREESYSPPGVNVLPHQSSAQQNTGPTERRARTPPAPPRARESESYSPPSPAVPLGKNLLGAPLAPQPARISPLASGNIPTYSQNDRGRNNNQNSAAIPAITGSKRKRDFNSGNKQPEPYPASDLERNADTLQQERNVSGSYRPPLSAQQNPHATSFRAQNQNNAQQANKQNRKRKKNNNNGQTSPKPPNKRVAQGAASPIPYIKEEPVSPPPPSHVVRREPPRRLVLRDDGRADIEIYSPPRDSVPERYQANGTSQAQPWQQENIRQVQSVNRFHNQDYREQMPIVIDSPRASSPMTRQTLRDSQSTRRMASAQYSSRPYSTEPMAGHPSQDIQYIRAPSRQIIERPLQAERYVDEPQYQYRQRPEPTSPTYRFEDESNNEIVARRAMPPPPTRRIVDQYGNEYVAVPSSGNRHQSVAREAYPDSRQSYQHDLYGDQPFRSRSQVVSRHQPMRAPPQVIELDDDEDDYRRMPPPPSSRQRFVQVVEQPQRRTVSYQPPQSARSMSLQPGNHSLRDQYLIQPPPPSSLNDTEPYGARDRPYSARPPIVETSPTYSRRVEYAPPEGMYRTW